MKDVKNTWLKTREELLRQLKAQVALRLGTPSRELRLYTRRFKAQFPKRWRESDKSQLLSQMAQAEVVFGSDFHAFSQAQRLHLRLLRELVDQRSIVLGCEFLEVRHQKWVDQLQKGSLSESAFLRKVQWQQRWGFPWDSYGALLKFARENGIRVLALNHVGPGYGLKKRDHLAARVLKTSFAENPEHLHYIIFGELHLSKGHLPKELLTQLGRKFMKAVYVYQDEEQAYFRLAKQGRESSVDVLKAGKERFCVLGSPPWVKWQSYAMYLEQTFDQDLEDSDLPLDLSDQFRVMTNLLARDFGVSLKSDSVTVYSSGEPQLWRELKSCLSRSQLKIARFLIESDRSFYLPQVQLAYVSRASVNHVADVAGRFIHASLGGAPQFLTKVPQQFEALVWIEAVGFFASKLINHKRAADTLSDLRAQMGALSPDESGMREVLRLALDYRAKEVLLTRGIKRKVSYKPRRESSYFEAARLLGAMMGERLYQSYRHHWFSGENLLSWLKQDVSQADFKKTYLEIVRRLEPGERLGKTRAERL